MMGAERRSMVMTEDEKKSTAYHEAGHALVSLHVDGCDPLHKVTIIPRGRALGVTWNLPERDRYSTNMKQMKARLALCFGGRIPERLIYGADEDRKRVVEGKSGALSVHAGGPSTIKKT